MWRMVSSEVLGRLPAEDWGLIGGEYTVKNPPRKVLVPLLWTGIAWRSCTARLGSCSTFGDHGPQVLGRHLTRGPQYMHREAGLDLVNVTRPAAQLKRMFLWLLQLVRTTRRGV